MDGKSGAFFRHARRSGLWPEAEAVHRSAVTKARAKLPWNAFAQLHQEAVRLAYDLWPDAEEVTWQGLSVFAIDGSKYRLPASKALREAFDPDSGLDHPGKAIIPSVWCPRSTTCSDDCRSLAASSRWPKPTNGRS